MLQRGWHERFVSGVLITTSRKCRVIASSKWPQSVVRQERRQWSGEGFPDYDDDAPLYDNIKRVFGATGFDLVYVYKPADHKGVAACPIPKSISYNEAWNHRRPSKRCSGMTFGSSSSTMPTTWLSSRGVGHSVTDASSLHIPHCAERAILSRLPGHGRIGRCRYCSRAL